MKERAVTVMQYRSRSTSLMVQNDPLEDGSEYVVISLNGTMTSLTPDHAMKLAGFIQSLLSDRRG